MKRDIAAEITAKIQADLESNTMPWQVPWRRVKGFPSPINASTLAGYSGSNAFWLAYTKYKSGLVSNQWATMKQINDLGGRVKAGSKGIPCVFYKRLDVKDVNKATGEESTKSIPMLNYFSVFNLTDVEGMDNNLAIELKYEKTEHQRRDGAEKILAPWRSKITERPSNRAFYRQDDDHITCPPIEQYANADEYYSMVFHELIHLTGHGTRLARKKGKEFGSKDYAFEELVAEIGASMLCAHVGMDYSSQHASYIKSWLELLQDDKKAFIRASSQAAKAVAMVLEQKQEEEPTDQLALF